LIIRFGGSFPPWSGLTVQSALERACGGASKRRPPTLADNLRKKVGGQVEIINMIVPLVNYTTMAVPTVPAW
jgi:hypothetical protein